MVVHPFAHAAEVLKFYREFMRTAPDELVAAAVLMTAPDGNKGCAVAVAYSGDLARGERVVAPLKAFGAPVMDIIGPMPYLAHQSLIKAKDDPQNVFCLNANIAALAHA